MKFYYFILIILATVACSEAPSNKTGFEFKPNHIAIMVNDLKETGTFYTDILLLEEIKITDSKVPNRWFKLNNGLEIHLVESRDELPKRTRNNHIALEVNNINILVEYLTEKNTPYFNWFGVVNEIQKRFDGVLQVYVKDPEENWIEINQKAN